MKYTCYSDMCARTEICPHCDQEMEVHGTVYDWEDYDIELQFRFVHYGLCCVCGLGQVEQ